MPAVQVTEATLDPRAPPLTRSFAFHGCLGPSAQQQDVMRMCGIEQLVGAALVGYNVTVLVYGQTGSGKTFTISGREDAPDEDGFPGVAALAGCLSLVTSADAAACPLQIPSGCSA